MRALALFAALALGACAGTAARGALASESARASATAAVIERDWPLAGAGPVTDVVREVGDRLEAAAGPVPFRWRFTVIRDRSLNAFAIGDGRIYVNEGALLGSRSEAELAAVLAHEMGHQLAGHFVALEEPPGFFSSLFGGKPRPAARSRPGIVQTFDLDQELEADRISLGILMRAGYDPHAALSVADRAGDPGAGGSSHFGDDQRLRALRRLLADAPRGGRPDGEAFRRLPR